MKKNIFIAFLLAVGCAATSQAVVIHWAVTTAVDGAMTAALVYVGTGGTVPTWDGSNYSNGGVAKETVEALPDYTVGAQATTDSEQNSPSGYYVVLFNNAGKYKVSSTWLSYDDKINGEHADAMTIDPRFPALGLFNPTFTGDWLTPVPEPSTLALLALGAAAVGLRRRKKS